MKRLFAIPTVGFFVVGIALAADAREPRNIGSVAAANEEVRGTPPQQDPRRLRLGIKLVEAERVETSSVGAGQFLFLDQTSLTVWPDSDIVLDKYLYDPDKATGQMALSATRGVLRFIGGKISKTTDVTVTTPHAIVAIRGGIAQIEVTADRTIATNIASEHVKVYNADGSVTLSRPMAAAEASNGHSPIFLGIGGPEAAAALYRRPLGIGNGGVVVPVTGAEIDVLADRSQIAALGSGDRSAPRKAPISTLGERDPAGVAADDEVQTNEGKRTDIDPQADKPEQLAQPPKPAPAPPTIVVPLVRPQKQTSPPPPLFDKNGLPLGPLPQFSGVVVSNAGPSGRGDLFSGAGTEQVIFTDASRALNGDAPPSVTVNADGAATSFTEVPGFQFIPNGGEINGQTANLTSFVDPGVFYLKALSADDGQTETLRLSFTGEATDRAVWAAPQPADTVTIRRYDVSNDLFSNTAGFLPAAFVTDDGSGAPSILDAAPGQLLLIGDPNGPTTPQFDPLQGPDAQTASKWGFAWLAIEGEGAEQTFAFGAMTALALPSETSSPTASGDLQFAVRQNSDAPASFATLPFGTFDDGDSQTAFGPDGEYFVFVNGGPYAANDDPAFEPGTATFSQWSETEDTNDSFGTTRLAELDSIEKLAADSRAPAAENNRFTGGFAIGHGQAFRPSVQGEQPLETPYLLTSTTPESVRFGFNPDDNAVAAEFSGLLRSGIATDIVLVNLNFGGDGAQSAYADDRTFFAQDSLGAEGALTGRAQSHSGRTGAADSADGRQNAFRGALAVSDITGDGGIFPDGVKAKPEYLRWGWWIGEYRHDPNDADDAFAGRTDRFIGGAWVTGVLSDIASVRAQSGTATFSGFAVANVIERAGAVRTAFVDGGSFDMTYNFANRTGAVQIDGIAGETLRSDVSELRARNGHHYSGALTGFRRVGQGDVSGAFFTGKGDPTAATAGNFDFQALTPDGKVSSVVGVYGADKE